MDFHRLPSLMNNRRKQWPSRSATPKSAFWTQMWIGCTHEEPWLQTSKVTALAHLPVQLELGLTSWVLALLNTAHVRKVQVMGVTVPYPSHARALQLSQQGKAHLNHFAQAQQRSFCSCQGNRSREQKRARN